MSHLSASEKRYLDNAALIGAQTVIFSQLAQSGVPVFKLIDIADTASGGTPDRTNSSYFEGSIPWMKSGELNDGIVTAIEESITETGLECSSAKIFPAGTLLIALYGATVGKTGVLGIDAATNQAVCSVIPKRSDIRVAYLHWFLRHKREDFLNSSFGGAQPNISQRILRDTLVPIPSPAVQDAVIEFLDAVEQRLRDRRIPLPDLLPPLAEQRRVVARIDELAAQIHEARSVRADVDNDLRALLMSAYQRIAESASRNPLGEVAPLNRRRVPVEFDGKYPQVSVRSFGKGTFHNPPLLGSEITWEKPYLVKSGDILISNIKAWEGAIAVATPNDDGRVASHRYLTCEPIPQVATPRFICFHLLTPEGLHDVGEASPGSADRNRTLSSKALVRIPVPVPPYQQQIWFDQLCDHVDALKRLQAETAAELDALLPAILDRAFKGEL